MNRRLRWAWAALSMLACYALPHRLMELNAAQRAAQATEVRTCNLP